MTSRSISAASIEVIYLFVDGLTAV